MRNRVFIKTRRQIRVFISSSFEDMDAERNYLRDVIFQRIQDKAKKRAVAVTALDLRWGIPDGTDIGKTIEICMNEIDNSYPFFIGIVGGKYGSQPDKKTVFDANEVLREQYSMLCKYFEEKKSITEMEMRYGVLDCNEEERKNINALFLTRKDDLKVINEDARLRDLNKAIKTCGEQFDERKITRKGGNNNHIWSSDYASIEEFGKIIEIVFDDILDRLFPKEANLDVYQQQFFMQESVMADLSRFYVPESAQIDAITRFVNDPFKQKLMLSGERGCGKSSLLAYWISQYSISYHEKETDFIYHFVGSGEAENDPKVIEKRILRAFSDLGVETKKNNEELSLRSLLFKDSLRDKGTIVIIVDAVDQLQSVKGFALLEKDILPRDVKLIVSTVTGDETEGTIRKSIPNDIISIPGLTTEEQRRRVIDSYIRDFHGRDLGGKNLTKVIHWPLSQNPLALMTLLNELLLAGRYDKMDALVDTYISCQSIDSLFEIILARLKNNPEYSWIDKALGAIALSRYGLSEDELQRIIPSHVLYWSSFYCFFQRHFFVRNGLITFAHQYLRKAVERTFIAGEDMQKQIHSQLIPLFENGHTARDQEELMHHYYALGDLQSLFTLISNPRAFMNLCQKDSANLRSYWEKLIDAGYSPSPLLINHEQCSELIYNHRDGIEVSGNYYEHLQWFLLNLHQYDLSHQLFQIIQEDTSKTGIYGEEYTRLYLVNADAYYEKGELENAIQNYKQSFWTMTSFSLDEKSQKTEFQRGLDEQNPPFDERNFGVYRRIALCYRRLGQYDNAQKYLDFAKQCMDSYKQSLDSKDDNAYILYWLDYARLRKDQGYDAGVPRFSTKKAGIKFWAEISSLLGNYRVSISLWHQYLNDLKGDSSFISGTEAAVAYQNIADSLVKLRKYWFAEQFIKASFRCVETREKNDYLTAKNYLLLGLIRYFQKDYSTSLDYHLKALPLLERMKFWPEWLDACQQAANISTWSKKTSLGLEILKKALKIVEQGNCCTDFQKAQLLNTLSSLEFLERDYHNSFEHAHSAFIGIAGKHGPCDPQVLKIIKRLDDCIKVEPSLFSSSKLQFSDLFIWKKYVLLSYNSNITLELKAHVCCCKYVSDSTSWHIINGLLNNSDEKTTIAILESESEYAFYDHLLDYLEKDYDVDVLRKVFMAVYFSHDLPPEWEELNKQYGALFNMQNGVIRFATDVLGEVVVSHFFRYEGRGSEKQTLLRFVQAMAPQYQCSFFSNMERKRYVRQLRQDADTLMKKLSQMDDSKAQQKAPLIPIEAVKIMLTHCTLHSDITMIMGLCSYEVLLTINSLEDDNVRACAQTLHQCIHFDALPQGVRGSIALVLGVKAYQEKDYTAALPFMCDYYALSYKNDSLSNRLKWNNIITGCMHIRSSDWDNIVPARFSKEWRWEVCKYKYIEKLLKYFTIADISEDKERKQITINLNEKQQRTSLDKTANRFRFQHYGVETRLVFRDNVQVVVCLRRSVWLDRENNYEAMNLYAIKYPDGVKLKDFNTYIKTVFRDKIYGLTNNNINQ